MDGNRFWALIDEARRTSPDPSDADAVASRAAELLGARPAAEIVAAQQALWERMAESYRLPLWAAAYTVNGGCSDDGFDYFRGWLILQGREVFERAVADPDSLAEEPAIRAARAWGEDVDGEAALGIAWNAHLAATGEELPSGGWTIRYPDPEADRGWDFDFDDTEEMRRRLPAMARLYGI